MKFTEKQKSKDKKKKKKEEKSTEKKRKKEKKEKREKDGKKTNKSHSHYSSGNEDNKHTYSMEGDLAASKELRDTNEETAFSHSTTPPPLPQQVISRKSY